MFNSNEELNCYCNNFASLDSVEGAYPCVPPTLPPQHHKPSLRSAATSDNLIGFWDHAEWVCTAPESQATTRGRQSGHIPKSGETQPRPTAPGDLRESHNDSVSKEILPLLPPPCRAFDLILLLPFPPRSALFFSFFEILIKRKDSHDECEVTPWQQKEMSGASEPPSNLKGLTFSIEI